MDTDDAYYLGKVEANAGGARTYYVYKIDHDVMQRINQLQTNLKEAENQGPMSANSALMRGGKMVHPNGNIICSLSKEYLNLVGPIIQRPPYEHFKVSRDDTRCALGDSLSKIQLNRMQFVPTKVPIKI